MRKLLIAAVVASVGLALTSGGPAHAKGHGHHGHAGHVAHGERFAHWGGFQGYAHRDFAPRRDWEACADFGAAVRAGDRKIVGRNAPAMGLLEVACLAGAFK
jgi:hypothetical protein